MTPEMTRALVSSILRNPHNHSWSLQGLGMLRTYLDEKKRYRLHIWSNADATPPASRLHDHPWSFTSYVVAGGITNYRWLWTLDPFEAKRLGARMWNRVLVTCGEACVAGVPEHCWLTAQKPEIITSGEWYMQHAAEVHDTLPEDGTVTIIDRKPGKDPDHAHVYYPLGEEWVSVGHVRYADAGTVKRITKLALDKWF